MILGEPLFLGELVFLGDALADAAFEITLALDALPDYLALGVGFLVDALPDFAMTFI